MQKVLIMNTTQSSVRADVDGWSYEDSGYVRQQLNDAVTRNFRKYGSFYDVPIGLAASGHSGSVIYPTVLHALSDGWKLLSPPVKYSDSEYEWWLTKG